MIRRDRERIFALTYDGPGDPDDEDTAAVLSILTPVAARVVLPGLIEVVGAADDVNEVAKSVRNWKISPERSLASRQPTRAMVER